MNRMLFLSLAAICLCQALPAADATGAWKGGYYGGPLYLALKQDGATLSGTAGPTDLQQFAKLDSGKIDAGHITFAVGPMQFDLQLEGNTLTGSVTASQDDPPSVFPVTFTRVGSSFTHTNSGRQFDVASVKVSQSAGGPMNGRGGRVNASRGQIVMDDVTLWKALAFANELSEDKDYAITGPNWIRSERYNIVVKIPPNSTWEDVKDMMQNLLAARFKLGVHWETKEQPVYGLVVAKSGTKLQEVSFSRGSFSLGSGMIKAQSSPLGMFADRLSQYLDRPVLDETGMKGVYTFTLQWTPDQPAAEPGAAPAAGVIAGPSLNSAIQEQLGLRLEPKKGAVKVLVVDKGDKVPIEN